MGLLTLSPMGFQTTPDPNDPKKMQIRWNPSLGATFLAGNGIILNVAISPDMLTVSTMQTQGMQTPQPLLCKALVDTGASGLAIDKSIAAALGLKKKGVTNNLTANGAKVSPVYFVSWSLNHQRHEIRVPQFPEYSSPLPWIIPKFRVEHLMKYSSGPVGT